MTADCVHLQWSLEAAKALGPSLAILAAAIAWLVNKTLGWAVWLAERFINRLEMMNALYADIATNLESERDYSKEEDGRDFLRKLTSRLLPDAPFVPYVAVQDKNIVLSEPGNELRALPPDIINSVVKYYNASEGLSRQLADFRSDAFLGIGRERQGLSGRLQCRERSVQTRRHSAYAIKKATPALRCNAHVSLHFNFRRCGSRAGVRTRIDTEGREAAQCGGRMGFVM